jgi:hypothetical protein
MLAAQTTLTNYPELPIIATVTYTGVNKSALAGKNMGNSRAVMGSSDTGQGKRNNSRTILEPFET